MLPKWLKLHFRWAHVRLMPPCQRTPTNIRINLIPLQSKFCGLHFCCRQYGSIVFQIFVAISERRTIGIAECVLTLQGLESRWFSRHLKGLCDFLLVISSNLGHISHRFWHTATYRLKTHILSRLFNPKCKNVSLNITRILLAKSCDIGLINGVIKFK